MTTKPRKQCRKCPWKVSTNPHDIPGEYCATKHANLTSTIAEPGDYTNLFGPLRMMACHETTGGRELPCVGWLDNQLNEGNNIALRMAVSRGKVSGNYELDGPQHRTLEDTLPKETRGKASRGSAGVDRVGEVAGQGERPVRHPRRHPRR